MTCNEKRKGAQKSRGESKRPLPCLTQGKYNSFPIRAGTVCQGKCLGGAFKMVNFFLGEMVLRSLLNSCLGEKKKQNNLIITAHGARQMPKPDAFDLKCGEGLAS